MNKILLIAVMATLALADIGKVAVVKGDASVERDIKVMKAHNNMRLLKQDVVETTDGRLQMHFNDNTVISLGKDSRFVIKEYLYSEDTQEVAATFRIEKGFIKTITGAIGKVMPELFVLETSTTKITPQGTIWSVKVDKDSEEYKVLEGKITLSFNDGEDRKVELLAGETASLKKGSNDTVTSFVKAKSSKSSASSKYEDSVEQDGGNLYADKMMNRDITVSADGSMIDEEGTEVHDNRDGLKNPKK